MRCCINLFIGDLVHWWAWNLHSLFSPLPVKLPPMLTFPWPDIGRSYIYRPVQNSASAGCCCHLSSEVCSRQLSFDKHQEWGPKRRRLLLKGRTIPFTEPSAVENRGVKIGLCLIVSGILKRLHRFRRGFDRWKLKAQIIWNRMLTVPKFTVEGERRNFGYRKKKKMERERWKKKERKQKGKRGKKDVSDLAAPN